MRLHSIIGASLLVSLALACSSGPSGPVTVTVSPAPADVLTCSTKTFTATVTGGDSAVTWSVDPSGIGSIDGAGAYTAPKQTPTPSTISVVATSVSDPTAHGSADATLATAFPGVAQTVPGSTALVPGVFPHAIASSGARAYAAWASPDSNTPAIFVTRSDDGGTTWKTGVMAMQVTLDDADAEAFDCISVAIDAGNPDVLYVAGRSPHANDAGDAVAGPDSGPTSILAVSTDGGATFTPYVMQVGGSAGGPFNGWDQVGTCGDVASPAANTVVFESPGAYGSDGNPDIAVWSDANRGAGFAQGIAADGDYVADGTTHALDDLQGNHDIDVAQNGGTDDAGGATESPRLFVDGAGRLCLTYYGSTYPNNGTQAHVYVQCSDDAAMTFSAPLVVDPAEPINEGISSPVGAFGPNHAAAILWTQGIGVNQLFIATSTDGGATFGAPSAIATYVLPNDGGSVAPENPTLAYDASGILWIAYRAYDGGFADRIIVDKSCDGGTTWSGPVLVNGPEANIVDMRWPTLVMTPGDAPRVAASADDHRAIFTLAP